MPSVQPQKHLVLICEDSEAYLSLEAALLDQHGLRSSSTRRDRLIDDVHRLRPRLVILALGQKGDGLDLAASLRSDAATRTLSILGTGIRGHISREEVRERGVNRLLWKPFSPDKLVRYVRELTSVAPRHPVSFDLKLRSKRPGGTTIEGMSVNLSESGILVWCDTPLQMGHRLVLEGAVGRGGLTLEVEVVREAKELGPGYYALKFRMGPLARPLQPVAETAAD